MNKKGRKFNLKIRNIVLAILLLVLIFSILGYWLHILSVQKEENKKAAITKGIKEHYNQYVITNRDADIYLKENEKYNKVGKIQKNIELTLDDIEITSSTKYFKINDFDKQYYIFYEDVDKLQELTEISFRYKEYIPFNENIVTKNTVHYYDESDNLLYTINEKADLPIIIKDDNRFGIIFNNRLLFVKKDDVESTKANHNTDLKNTNHIGALNYHFFWDDEKDDQSICNQVICHSKSQFKSHLDLINEMHLLTITMKEAEMYIDGKLQLPKSVLITIDDGWYAALGIQILNEYKMYGTLFLITGSYDPQGFLTPENKYVELHSHTDKLHAPGKCPGGQGGGLKCLPRDEILADLKTSREKLNGSTVLCYPFYEYNNYTISLVKEAGFTMAFAGESYIDGSHFTVGSNKYALPRFVVATHTTLNDLRSYFN